MTNCVQGNASVPIFQDVRRTGNYHDAQFRLHRDRSDGARTGSNLDMASGHPSSFQITLTMQYRIFF